VVAIQKVFHCNPDNAANSNSNAATPKPTEIPNPNPVCAESNEEFDPVLDGIGGDRESGQALGEEREGNAKRRKKERLEIDVVARNGAMWIKGALSSFRVFVVFVVLLCCVIFLSRVLYCVCFFLFVSLIRSEGDEP
jgi:hypothetical protein